MSVAPTASVFFAAGAAAAIIRALGPALCVALLLAAAACGPHEPGREIRLEGDALGTFWSVTLQTRPGTEPARTGDLRQRVEHTLERVDRGMSTWREDAEIVRFNRRGDTAPFRLSAETRRVVVAALDLARETHGAFDPTVGPLVRLWGFGSGARRSEPSAAEVAAARAHTGWHQLRWEGSDRLASRVVGVELDLSAIAKGYAVDAVVRELLRDRPPGLLVEIGGEVRAVGARADGAPWRLGVQDPDGPPGQLASVVLLAGGALATSGDYRQSRVTERGRVTHVIDPRSGRPVQTGIVSASVVAPSCTEADAVATALIVLGADAALRFVEERPWLDALLLVRRPDRALERRASAGWSRWAAPPP
jgi:thiamine biosynthesis lipoprotein